MTANSEKVLGIMRQLANDIKLERFIQDRSGVKLVERRAVLLDLDPADPIIDVGAWRTNEEYVKKELAWYLSEDRNITGHVDDVKIWKQVADKDGVVNSNYGWCLFSEENGLQYQHVIEELVANPSSRRASMIYTRPSMWTDATENGRNDFICTWGAQAYIRDERLEYHVLQRSCDQLYGFFNDLAWHCYVAQLLAEDLDAGLGHLYYFIDSLHVYERHFPRLLKLLEA